jgi:hypothetical protein
VVPTCRAEHLEFAVFEPRLGRCSRGDLPEGALAVVAPRVGARRISIVAPKETNADARIDSVRDMRAYESYSLPTVSGTPHLGHATTDFSSLLRKVKEAAPDVLMAASVRLEALVAITRQIREADLNVKMLSSVPYGLVPDYYKQLGKQAEFVYSGSFWETGIRETRSSSQRTKRNLAALRLHSRLLLTPPATSLRRRYDGSVAWTPISSARRC